MRIDPGTDRTTTGERSVGRANRWVPCSAVTRKHVQATDIARECSIRKCAQAWPLGRELALKWDLVTSVTASAPVTTRRPQTQKVSVEC